MKMKIINRRLTPKQFIFYIYRLKVRRKINEIVLHHTSSPIESWQGSGSMLHYWNLYKSRGWKSGPHIFIASNGIWLFTPINKRGTHATKQAAKNSIGIEIVGRYFDCEPKDEKICYNAALVINVLKKNFSIKDINSHHYYDKEAGCSPYTDDVWADEIERKYKDKIEQEYITKITLTTKNYENPN